MDTITLHDIRERLVEANVHFPERNFQLLFNPAYPHLIYIVDLARPARSNVLGYPTAVSLIGDDRNFFFEVYYIGDVAADEYCVEPGYYLAISFYL